LIDVPSNIDGPPNRERGMMFRRQIYDAHRQALGGRGANEDKRRSGFRLNGHTAGDEWPTALAFPMRNSAGSVCFSRLST
jgi:hypothetical protein